MARSGIIIRQIISLQKRKILPTGLTDIGSFAARILIVDDDPDITSLFRIGLEDSGFEVYSYNDALQVLANF